MFSSFSLSAHRRVFATGTAVSASPWTMITGMSLIDANVSGFRPNAAGAIAAKLHALRREEPVGRLLPVRAADPPAAPTGFGSKRAGSSTPVRQPVPTSSHFLISWMLLYGVV